jgi:CubicO group peptidase (beta-lactamase class C family)
MTGLIAAAAAELQARLVSFVRENRLPGGAAGVVHGGELAWSSAVGYADTGTRRPAGPGTLYRIASITKPFTGTAVMQLRDAGQLDLDDPAVTYLPELRGAVSPFAPIETVTIRRMLSHESGLASEPPGTDWAVPAYEGDPGRTLARAGDIVLQLPPNAQHKYSDLAYQLLGEIVTRVSGVPYPQYLRESVLGPLGLADTGFDPLDGPQLDRRATGYDWRALSDALDVAPDLSPPVWAEGGLWSSVPDLARWVCFQLSAYGEPAAGPPVLAAATLREMHQPRYLGGDDWATAWGISWCANRRDDVTWIQHSGWIPGFTGTVCFDPATQTGAVALVNGTSDSTQLAFDLASAARRLAQATPVVITAPEPVPAPYRPLLGFYVRPQLGGWILRLEWRDGQLVFTSGDPVTWQVGLVPSDDPDVFAPSPGSGVPGDSVTFRRLGDGRVASVHLMDSTFVRLDQVAGAIG